MQETQVRSLGKEDPLEKGMASLSNILSCLENPMDRGALVDYSLWSCKELDKTEQLTLSLSLWVLAPEPHSPLSLEYLHSGPLQKKVC